MSFPSKEKVGQSVVEEVARAAEVSVGGKGDKVGAGTVIEVVGAIVLVSPSVGAA